MTDPTARGPVPDAAPASPRVTFQGEAGAYSEIAARQAGSLSVLGGRQAVPVPLPSFAAVFSAVTTGEVEFGVVPVENSLAGAVHQNVDLLLDSDLHVAGEVIVRVAHCLL
ncbi:MAG TPA: prephenate dehydratase domain-containing protein, partial [Deinococcales bacterium]|nr:prephenate dehydratase domain-containing protein [Deinococcales bacterium]